MNHRICNICYEYNDIQNKSTYNCPNAECSAYSCKSCLIKWFTDNNKCPICHINVNLHEIEKLDDPLIINEEAVVVESTPIMQKYKIRCNRQRVLFCYFISFLLFWSLIITFIIMLMNMIHI